MRPPRCLPRDQRRPCGPHPHTALSCLVTLTNLASPPRLQLPRCSYMATGVTRVSGTLPMTESSHQSTLSLASLEPPELRGRVPSRKASSVPQTTPLLHWWPRRKGTEKEKVDSCWAGHQLSATASPVFASSQWESRSPQKQNPPSILQMGWEFL